MERYERLWDRLLTLLGTLGEVDATVPGRIRLVVDGDRLEIVMTEIEWDDLVSTLYGSFSGAACHLLHVLTRAQMDGVGFLVYDMYQLQPSSTPESPERLAREADDQRVAEYLRDHPDAKREWRAYPPGSGPA